MSNMVKRWEAHYPGIDAMRLEEIVRPEAGPGEVLVRGEAVSLNYRDLAMLEGSLGKWTGVQLPGSEMAGEVEAVGAGVTRFAVGDKVISVDIRHWIDGPAPEVGTNTAPFAGRLAEYVTVPEDLLVRAPAMLDAAAASTLSVAVWDARVLEIMGGRGADHVLEMGGGDITRSVNAIRIGGRISIIGLLSGTELRVPIRSVMLKRAQLVGLGVGHRRALEDTIAAIDHLKLRPVVDAVYPFSQAPEAFAHLKRGAVGKVVVRIER